MSNMNIEHVCDVEIMQMKSEFEIKQKNKKAHNETKRNEMK